MRHTAKDIALAFELKPNRTGYSGACPCCGYKTGFTLTEKQGKILFYCHAGGCQGNEIIAAIRGLGLWGAQAGSARPVHILAQQADGKAAEAKTRIAMKIWNETQPVQGSLAEVYLRSRGITCPLPGSLRFHPNLKHSPTGQYYPGLIAKVTPWEGSPIVAIHRTYLTHDGTSKIDHDQAKMMLGSVEGRSVHLAEPEGILAVSEGIENGLSIYQATGIPTWAAMSWGGIKNLILPPLPQAAEVIICADYDPCGLKGATMASERWVQEGRLVKVAKPYQPGQDFNDLLRERNPNE